ncbi:MAG TPA: murein biosynthesis integral membrane protein MurJ, partial [Actinomycetota bacterium]|nr:murein biosynthesis integral membrane protein MurJ [Actinomycetota bacterium]
MRDAPAGGEAGTRPAEPPVADADGADPAAIEPAHPVEPSGDGPGEPPPGPPPSPPSGRDAGGVRLLRSTAVMSVGTGLSRLTGFLRLSAMAYAMGVPSGLADAYNVANNTPNIVYELVLGGVLTSVFVPVFVDWLERRGREESWEVARQILTIAFVSLSAITLLTMLFAPAIVGLYTTRLPHNAAGEAERDLATFFLRWFMPQIVFYGLGAVASGLLNAHRRFAAPMFAPILNNLTVIATMVLFVALPRPAVGISDVQRYVLAIGTTLGVVLMTVALVPSLRRTGFRFAWRWNWRSEAVRRIARLASWVFVYVLVNQVGLVVIIILATGAKAYAVYSYSFILFQLPHAIFAVSVMTALLPALSAHWANRETDSFRDLLGRGIRLTALAVVPSALGYIALAGPISRLVFEHGRTDAAGAAQIAGVLRIFAVGLFAFSTFQLLLRAFYSMQDSRTPALVNVAAVTVNTVVNIALFHWLGARGLAVGYVAAYTFGAVVLAVLIRRRVGGLGGAGL